jgi:hypothetical protein
VTARAEDDENALEGWSPTWTTNLRTFDAAGLLVRVILLGRSRNDGDETKLKPKCKFTTNPGEGAR